jgi:RNA polymerase sigma factor (sigma-70 family)
VIRVLLVDDHASFRQPLAFLLSREPDITVAGQAGTLAEARRLLRDIDVAVIDLALPDGDGVALIEELRAVNPRAAALVLTASTDRRHLARAVEAGAVGVLHKSAEVVKIIAAIRRLGAGEWLLTPREIVELLRLAGQQREQCREAEAALARLTAREREVLQALADGLSDREIAARLHISSETVRTHMSNILSKLGVQSRLQALVFALRHGAVTIK